MVLRFTAAALVALLLAACGGNDGRSRESYFGELAPIMRRYHDDLAAQRGTWAGMDDDRLSAAYAAYGQALQAFAADAGAVEPAADARDAQDAMVIATRALGNIYADRAASLTNPGTPAPDFDGREERRSSEWFTACHDLQDLALVDEIDVDLLCATMLSSNAEPTE